MDYILISVIRNIVLISDKFKGCRTTKQLNFKSFINFYEQKIKIMGA